MDGLLILDKPRGLTSQQAIGRVRRALKIKKAGHTGTLDPLATGVLPIALGEATKIIPYLEENTKSYRVTGRLGETTDSYDSDGTILRKADAAWVQRSDLESEIQKFLGDQEQIPPAYSAIKVQGRPLYDYARSGVEVELKARRIHFSALELENFSAPDFTLKVDCSKGTYVRSLIHDIGEGLGCGAHVTALRRLASGAFNLDRAVDLDLLLENPERAAEHLLSIEDLLQAWPHVELEAEEVGRVISGVPLYRLQEAIRQSGWFDRKLSLVHNSVVWALIEAGSGGAFEYLRVLHRQPAVKAPPTAAQTIENT